MLLSEHIVMSDDKTMTEQLRKFSDLQNSLKEHQEVYNYVNSVGHELIMKTNGDSQGQRLKDALQDLITKWSDIPIILEERQQNLQKGMYIYMYVCVRACVIFFNFYMKFYFFLFLKIYVNFS